MDLEVIIMRMEICTKVNGNKIKKMVKELCAIKTEIVTMDNGKIICVKEKVEWLGRMMTKSILDFGERIRDMVKER